MKIVDNMPIIIVIAAIFINIAIGVNNGLDFSAIMIRSIIVTVVFSIFGYMITETVKNAIECSSLSKLPHETDEEAAESEESQINSKNESLLDIKVPPLDDIEFMDIDNDDDEGFVEVNPVDMGNYDKEEQD